MINHQDQITILTPTMNRSEFVLRSLQYYAKVGFTGTFMIGDSSNELERTKIESYIAEYKSKLRIIYLYFRFLQNNHSQLNIYLLFKYIY